MTSKFTKMTRSEYRWKILLPPYYENGLDGSPTLKGEWISSKRECYKDFLKKNSEIDGDREAYLYKRMILPDHFLIFGKSKYHEYKYKIKASFHREGFSIVEHGLPSKTTTNRTERGIFSTFASGSYPCSCSIRWHSFSTGKRKNKSQKEKKI